MLFKPIIYESMYIFKEKNENHLKSHMSLNLKNNIYLNKTKYTL